MEAWFGNGVNGRKEAGVGGCYPLLLLLLFLLFLIFLLFQHFSSFSSFPFFSFRETWRRAR